MIPSPRKCQVCDKEYTPKPRGYNSLYCSKNCKNRLKARPAYNSEKRRQWYIRYKLNPLMHEKHKRYGSNGKKKIRKWLAEYKLDKGCCDCGYNEYSAALQLDHEGDKKFDISQIRSSITRILTEIEQGNCKVRCARCHAVKTWHEINGLEYKTTKDQISYYADFI